MARFRVRVYRELEQEYPDGDLIVSAKEHVQAAARVLRQLGGGHAAWIRTERCGHSRSVVCFLDSTSCGGTFEYEASYRRSRGEGV